MARQFELRDIVAAYVAEKGNAAAAARAVGAGETTVRNKLRSPEGQDLLAEYTGEILEAYRVSAMRVVGEAAAIGFSDITDVFDINNVKDLRTLPVQVRAAIMQVEADSKGNIIKLRMHPKLDALKLLAAYTSIAGLGDTEDPTSSRPELGGLTIVGGTDQEASHNATPNPTTKVVRVIPKAEKLD